MNKKEFHDLSELALNSEGQSWGNLGYWIDGERNYSRACRTLALKLGEAADLNERSVIFDAGFGCGDQLLLWLNQFKALDICGINISGSQTQKAKSLLTKARHANKSASIATADIDHEDKWSAVVGDRNISHILALDCVYHFPSRVHFFDQSSSYLKPGGKLALTDFLLPEQNRDNIVQKLLLLAMFKLSRIPYKNMVGKASYQHELEVSGFRIVEFRNISQPVMGGFSNWVRSGKSKNLPLMSRVKYGLTAAFLNWSYNRSILQYSIIVAEKTDR